MSIELPKDAEGREIPLDTVALFNRVGNVYSIVRWTFTTDFDLSDGWSNKWRAITDRGFALDPALVYLTTPDTWEKLEEDLGRGADARARGGMRMACRPPVGDGPKGPSTKSTHPLRDEWALRKGRSSYVLWTDEMIGRMQAHPERTAAEIAAELRVTPSAVRHARQRYGRFSTGTDGLCIVCDARPVFDTSAQAKKWRLCKGCYLAERKRRLEEEAESNRIRQAAHRRQKLDGDV